MTFSTHGDVRYPFDPFPFLNSMVKGMKDVYQFLIFSSVFMGITGMAMIYTSDFIQRIPLSVSSLLIMFLYLSLSII